MNKQMVEYITQHDNHWWPECLDKGWGHELLTFVCWATLDALLSGCRASGRLLFCVPHVSLSLALSVLSPVLLTVLSSVLYSSFRNSWCLTYLLWYVDLYSCFAFSCCQQHVLARNYFPIHLVLMFWTQLFLSLSLSLSLHKYTQTYSGTHSYSIVL